MNSLNPWPWPIPEPGVYFDMSFDDYLAIPALQSSSIKLLLVSGPNFWAESWMNEFKKARDTKPFSDGRAYHKRVLEGKERFYEQYAADFEDDGAEDVLRTTDDIKTALERLGQAKTFGTKAEGARRLLAVAPQKKILEVMREDYRAAWPGREFLAPDLVREIEMGARAIEYNRHINHWLKGGYPEVTVIWIDPVTGIAYKARFDYLKIKAIADLKTFANERGRRIKKAISHAIAGNKYFIQSGFYLQAAEKARRLILDGHVFKAGVDVPGQWLELFAATPIQEFRFIMHQKGQALVTAGVIHSVANEKMQQQSRLRLEEAAATFQRYYAAFGSDPWVMMEPPTHLDYDEFPSYVNDL